MSEPKKYKVAVYGTLRPEGGASWSSLLSEKADHLGTFTIPGRLFKYHYPMLVPGENKGNHIAVVDVFEVNGPILAILDRIEGYNEHLPQTSLYIRKEIEIDGIDGKSFTYINNNFEAEFAKNDYNVEGTSIKFIDHGDYIRFLNEKS